MITKTNLIMKQNSLSKRLLSDDSFSSLLTTVISAESFGSVSYQLEDSYDQIIISYNENLRPVVDGERQKGVYEVHGLFAYPCSGNKIPNMFDVRGPQLFKIEDLAAAADTFISRCKSENIFLAIPHPKAIFLFKD